MNFQIEGEPPITDWPLTQSAIDAMGSTKLVSPRPGNAHGFVALDDDERQRQVEDTERACLLTQKNIWPAAYLEKYGVDPEPSKLLRKYLRIGSAKAGAMWVKADYPFDAWDKMIEPYARDEGIEWMEEPKHKGVPFVESVQRRAWAHQTIADALDRAFDVKAALGSQRPWQMSNFGKLMEMYDTADHGEEPAGHGTVFGATAKMFIRQYAATPEQTAAVYTATKQLAMFRSFAWQHIPHSNLMGWKFGFEMTA